MSVCLSLCLLVSKRYERYHHGIFLSLSMVSMHLRGYLSIYDNIPFPRITPAPPRATHGAQCLVIKSVLLIFITMLCGGRFDTDEEEEE